MITDILILITLWLIVCVLCFLSGFLIGHRQSRKEQPKISPAPLTEEQERKIEKLKRETENFWNYDGSGKQDDFNA